MILPFVFFSRPREASLIPEQPITFYYIFSNLFFIGFYYLNAYYLIPRLLAPKKLLYYISVIFLLFIFFGTFPRLYDYLTENVLRLSQVYWRPNRQRNLPRALLSPGTLAIFLLVFAISTGIKVVEQWFQSERKAKEIENEKLNTELSFLKAQINPHFLFNTLNNIYSLAAAQSEKTAEAVLKLSSIMRYVLTEVKKDTVTLEKEIIFITHYIELQKLRLTDKSNVDFEIVGDTSAKQISPLLFLPFVENAFKYGISTRDLSPIHLRMELKNDDLCFSVCNNKYKSSLVKSNDNNTGIGIENARRRLELLYKNRYTLEIAENAKTYTVNLHIHLL
jgi:two-component system LytT family sensor kinase